MRKKLKSVDLLRIKEINELLPLEKLGNDRIAISKFINSYLDKRRLLMYSLKHKITQERKCYFEVNEFAKERILDAILMDINETQKAILRKRMAIETRIAEITAIYNENKNTWSNEYGYEYEEFRRKPYDMGQERL